MLTELNALRRIFRLLLLVVFEESLVRGESRLLDHIILQRLAEELALALVVVRMERRFELQALPHAVRYNAFRSVAQLEVWILD